MGEYGRPSSMGGDIGENQAQQNMPPSYLTASSAIARAQALLRPSRGGAPHSGLPASLAHSPQLDNQLVGQTMLVQSNNGMSRRLALPTPQRVVQAQRPRYHAVGSNGALPSSSMRPQSTRYLTQHPYHAVRFLSGSTGATFRFLNAPPVLGTSGSIRAQSDVLINNVDSGHRNALVRESGTRTVQRREIITCCDAMALFMRTRGMPGREVIHRVEERGFLTGTGSVHPAEPVGFEGSILHERLPVSGTGSVRRAMGSDDGHLHGHSPFHSSTRSVLCSQQPMGFRVGTPQMVDSSGAGMARGGDNRVTTAARNEEILRRLNRMVRIGEDAARARAAILAATRGRVGRGDGSRQEPPDGSN